MFTTTVCFPPVSENNAASWGPDPVDSVGLGVAWPSGFYQAPHELVLQVVLRAPMGLEAKPMGVKPSGYIILGSCKTGP